MNKLELLKKNHLELLKKVANILNISESNIKNVQLSVLGINYMNDEKVLVIDTLNGRTWLRHTTYYDNYYLDCFENGKYLIETTEAMQIADFIKKHKKK